MINEIIYDKKLEDKKIEEIKGIFSHYCIAYNVAHFILRMLLSEAKFDILAWRPSRAVKEEYYTTLKERYRPFLQEYCIFFLREKDFPLFRNLLFSQFYWIKLLYFGPISEIINKEFDLKENILLKVGDRVEIVSGDLEGIPGKVLEEIEGKYKVELDIPGEKIMKIVERERLIKMED